MAGFNLFFQGLQQLEGIRLARERQRLDEQNSGAVNLAQYQRAIAGLTQEARVPFTSAYAKATGLDEALLQQAAANVPTSTELVRDRKVGEGAGAVPAEQVASTQLAGQTRGALAVDTAIAGGASELTDEEKRAGAIARLTGMSPGSFALDRILENMPEDQQQQMVEIDRGLQLSAPQAANVELSRDQMALQANIAASDDAIRLHELNARIMLAGRQAGAGEGAGIPTPQDIQDALKFEAGVMLDLQTKSMSTVAQIQGVTAIYQSMLLRGIPEDVAADISGLNAVRKGDKIGPSTFQRIFGTGKIVK